MAQPTPWQASENRPDPPGKSGRQRLADYQWPDLRPHLATLRGQWGYVVAAAGSVITLVLLFQPWITAKGPNGHTGANAFGRVSASTAYLTAWSQHRADTPPITGIWAILTGTAIVVVCLTTVVNLRLRTPSIARVTAISSVTTAFLVVLTLIYLNSKGPALKAMTARTYDVGGQLGSLMSWAFGNGTPPVPGLAKSEFVSASLTSWGLLAAAISVGSAIAAVVQWVRNNPDDLAALRLRSPIVTTRAQAETTDPVAADRPGHDDTTD